MVSYGNKARLITMLVLTGSFFLAEIITGYLTNSMALVADSFHMLSDVLSLMIGFLAVHYSGKKSKTNTYSWARAEILGAMANAVFLMALVFTIVIAAIQRIIIVEPITQPLLVLGVGAAGLVINLVGLVIFGSHGHDHHGHSHGHGHSHDHGGSHSHGHKHSESNEHSDSQGGNYGHFQFLDHDTSHSHDHDHSYDWHDGSSHNSHNHYHGNEPANSVDLATVTTIVETRQNEAVDAGNLKKNNQEEKKKKKKNKTAQMNMQAVFLHVLGDALGSVVVIISALVIYFVEDEWRYYVDPVMSLVTAVIISCTTIPLLRRASMILLQNPPTSIKVDDIKEKMMQIPGILGIHDLHIWQLSSDCVIATVHVIINESLNFVEINKKVKQIFHDADIHATTIQPELATPRTRRRAVAAAATEMSADDVDITACNCHPLNRFKDGEDHVCGNEDHDSGISYGEDSSSTDTSCLMSCTSDECQTHMCCDGVRQKALTKSPNSFSNPGYEHV